MTQSLSLIRHKERYLSHFSKFFMELLFQYFNEIERVRVEYVVKLDKPTLLLPAVRTAFEGYHSRVRAVCPPSGGASIASSYTPPHSPGQSSSTPCP